MFVTFEGVEGCGKTTQARLLAQSLRSRGLVVLLTREPGGSPVGPVLRSLLLSRDNDLSPRTELFLYAAERAEHVDRVIGPALTRDEWVICDRYGDATRAYQAYGRGLPLETVERVHAAATGGVEPDLTLFLLIPVEEGLRRARARNGLDERGEDRFEAESLAFHRRVAEGYERLAEASPDRILTVDATGSPEVVHRRILSGLEARIGLLA